MVKFRQKIIVVLGPTACGKTRVGVKLAKKFNGEIISADSRQVYIGMDVGTGKDLNEYKFQYPNPNDQSMSNVKCQMSNVIPYHLIDVVSPRTGIDFNVARFQKLAYQKIGEILERGKMPIIVGGTGLYIDAVVEGYQLAAHSSPLAAKTRKRLNNWSLKKLLAKLKKIDLKTYKAIDQKNRRRVQRALEIYFETGKPKSEMATKQKPPYQFLKIGINYPREVLNQRIERRLKERLKKEGMIAEVKKLHRQGLSWQRLENFGLEYRWVARYLQKKVSYEEMFKNLNQEIKNFAKRQMTWFKRDEKIIWENNYNKIEKKVKRFLK